MESCPTIVGLLGGIASGKSTVAKILGEMGAERIDADHIAHAILEDPEFRPELTAMFGEGAVDAEGNVDRQWIADRVFGNPERLKELEQALHPRVRARIRSAIDAAQDREMIVLDAPILLEGGLGHVADCLVYVESPRETRFARARERRGWSLREVARREQHQMSLAEKRRRADYTIVNDGDLGGLRARVEEVREKILRDRPRKSRTNEGDAEDGS